MCTFIPVRDSGAAEPASCRIIPALLLMSLFLAVLPLALSLGDAHAASREKIGAGSQASLPASRKGAPKQTTPAKAAVSLPKKAITPGQTAQKNTSAPGKSASTVTPPRALLSEDKRKELRERGIFSGYGPRSISQSGRVTRFHKGIDISTPTGSGILAFNDGVVVSSERHRNYGINVVIRQLDGRCARYAHMSKSLVEAGQTIVRGERIGVVGRTGRTTGSHLHFELYEEDGGFMDPAEHIWLSSELVINPRDLDLYEDALSVRMAAIERLKGEQQYSD